MQGPSRRDTLVIGNSHTTAIAAALAAAPDQRFDLVNVATYFDPINRKNKLVPPEIVKLFQPRRIFCTFGGSEHSVFGLLEAPRRFDFMTPVDSHVEPTREIVPYALIRATLAAAMATAVTNLKTLRKLYDCPITHLCTPPPFHTLGERQVLPRVFQENLHLGVSPPSLRRKLHWVHSTLAREFAESNGIGFIDVPAVCRDEHGYLLPEYWSKDPTHGNARYGALVLQQIGEANNV